MIRNVVVRDVISGCRGFVIDAFPATEEDAILFGALIAQPKVCLCLEASERTMVDRSMRQGREERGITWFLVAPSCDDTVNIRRIVRSREREKAIGLVFF